MTKRYKLKELFGISDKRDDLIEEISKHVKILIDQGQRFSTWLIYLESKKGKCAYIVYDWPLNFVVVVMWSNKWPVGKETVRMFCSDASRVKIVISDDDFSLMC